MAKAFTKPRTDNCLYAYPPCLETGCIDMGVGCTWASSSQENTETWAVGSAVHTCRSYQSGANRPWAKI